MDIAKTQLSFDRFVWETDLTRQPPAKAAFIRTLRLMIVVTRDIGHRQLSLQAMSLVYTTLLALIPLLVVTFSILKGFGVHQQIEPMLANLLGPLGDKGVELSRQVVQLVSKMRVGVLGAVGFGLLLYTSISLIQKIEQALNSIWHVQRQRRLVRRFGDYLTIIVVGPILFFTALGVTASLASSGWLKPLHLVTTAAAKLVPYLLVISAYVFAYVFIPNTKVKLRSAFIGALIAGVLWQTAGWTFAGFIAGSGQYRTVYASFAILILFMLWLYLCWLILLIGASIAFYHQNPSYLTREPRTTEAALSNRRRERLGLRIARVIGEHYYQGRPAWTAPALAHELHSPLLAVEQLLAAFEAQGLLARTRKNPPTYLPTRALEAVSLTEILRAIRAAGTERGHEARDPAIDTLAEKLAAASEQVVAGQTWRDLLAETPRAEKKAVSADG